MSRAMNSVWLAIFCLAAIAAYPASAADDNPSKPGDTPAAKAKPADEKSANKADPFAVPAGEPKDLIEFMKKTAPALRDPATLEKAKSAILKAADKVLAAKATDDELTFAVQAKMSMLQDEKQLVEFAAELKKGGHENLARQVRGFILQGELRKAMMAKPEQMKIAIGNVVKYIEEAAPQPSDVGLAFMAGRLAEMAGEGDNAYAVGVYRSLGKAFAASKNEKLADFAKTLDGVVRRLDLLGKEMKIEGNLVGGKAFDWSKYKDKVVLVDFWATWCGPCVGEIPNMKKVYKFYHAKGFEIVGISCDSKLSDLEKFVKEKEIPWMIVFGDGKPSPTVSYYGIMGIPTMILVGKDGKVVSLNARGEKLEEEVAKILGPMPKEEKKDKKKSEEK